ncbi:MAG TPA: hypothetical protein VF978_05820 [Gemmatimonadales bacterium]
MRRGLVLLAVLGAAACVEQLVAPGQCPDFCPDRLSVVDTMLVNSISRDSAFRGYIRAHESTVRLVANHPHVRSFALSKTFGIIPHFVFGADTAPIIGVDSVRVEFTLVQRDTAAHNLLLRLYRVAKTFDSTTTFGAVAPAFTDSLVRSVNLDTLLAFPQVHDSVLNLDIRRDTITGDYVRVDSLQRRVIVNLKLDSAQAPYVPADSGRLAFGIGVSADISTTTALGSRFLPGTALSARWFVKADSAQLDTIARPLDAPTDFDTFVFDPPLPPIDSTLAVGGIPAARSLLRVNLPIGIRDSAQIIRATLVLVPDRAAQGAPADSFLVAARRVQSDLGAKSVPAAQRFVGDSTHAALAWVRIGSTDTVNIEVTGILRFWASDTTQPTAFLLQQTTTPFNIIEGASLAEIRFRPSSDAAFRPVLHITYLPRYNFTIP